MSVCLFLCVSTHKSCSGQHPALLLGGNIMLSKDKNIPRTVAQLLMLGAQSHHKMLHVCSAGAFYNDWHGGRSWMCYGLYFVVFSQDRTGKL